MVLAVDASVTLHNGDVVRAHVDGADGEDRATVEGRAKTELQRILGTSEYDGRDVIDVSARIEFVTDDRSTPNPRDFVRSMPAGSLVMNNAVRLFGAPPVGNGGGGADTARMWAPVQNTIVNGTTYTVYREANYVNEAGNEAGGRLVRIPHGGGDVQIQVGGEWRRLYDYTGNSGANPTPGGSVPDADLRPVSDTALVPMSPTVPNGVTVTDDGLFYTFNLTSLNQENVGGRIYDVYEAPGPYGMTMWRRPHDGPNRAWESRRGSETWGPAGGVVSAEIASIVRSTPPGWIIDASGDFTNFSETSGGNRRIRISNTTGAVEVGTLDAATHNYSYRAATADDHLPTFEHLPPPAPPPAATITETVTDRGRAVSITSASGEGRFRTMPAGPNAGTWELFTSAGTPPVIYGRLVDATTHQPIANTPWKRIVPGTTAHPEPEFVALTAAAPHVGGGGRRSSPSRVLPSL